LHDVLLGRPEMAGLRVDCSIAQKQENHMSKLTGTIGARRYVSTSLAAAAVIGAMTVIASSTPSMAQVGGTQSGVASHALVEDAAYVVRRGVVVGRGGYRGGYRGAYVGRGGYGYRRGYGYGAGIAGAAVGAAILGGALAAPYQRPYGYYQQPYGYYQQPYGYGPGPGYYGYGY
jgi:hypothetical protein